MKREYGRTTITVPWELKERMKKARSYVNWSSVACEAFEQKLSELGPLEEITSVDGALARMKSLQASSPACNDRLGQTGKEAGTYWALNFADPNQLSRMEKFRNGFPEQEWEAFMNSREGWVQLGKCIAPGNDRLSGPRSSGIEPVVHDPWNAIGGPSSRHRRPRMGKHSDRGMEIWRSILDRRPDQPGFFRGFAEGALDVWKKIKDQL